MMESLKSIPMTSNQQDYIDQAVKRYSSLFTLPTHRRVLVLLFALCLGGGLVALLPFSQFYFGIALGLGFFVITIFSDAVICRLLGSEPIYNARRCNALSLYSSVVWFALMFMGTGLGLYFGSADVWLKLFLLGFCAVSLLRLLVYSATLFKGITIAFISALLQPIAWLVFVYLMWPLAIGAFIDVSFFVFPMVSLPIIVATVSFFVFLINQVGKRTLGVSSMMLLKTFLVNWIEDINAPLENTLEKLGTEQSVDVSFLVFRNARNKMKAVMVVPALHPGPFKNVGSSFLPYLVQSELEKRLDCVVSVPHGLFGHELDLASQAQNQKVINAILNSLNLDKFGNTASPFKRARSEKASACCQVFNDCALLALTVAPDTTEDLPQELGFLAIEEAEKKGLASAIVINAHNSIDSDTFNPETLVSLKRTVTGSISETASSEHLPLRIGAAKLVPNEFSLEDGMGPGGISVIVSRVGEQTVAYVTIDGNNMVSGLRESILTALRDIGVDDGEILTTDTHAVSAVVLNRRGYHPVGEVMDQDKLIYYIKTVVSEAVKNLEPIQVAWRSITVPNVKVIGAKQIEGLCTLTDKAMKKAKSAALTLFPIASAVLILLLLLT